MLAPPRSRPLAEAARLARGISGWPGAYLRAQPQTGATRRMVLVVPGYATGDGATFALRAYLRRVGHAAEGWALGINRGDVTALTPRVAERIAALSDRWGGPIAVVGWSLGGVLAREATRRDPSRVERIVTLGTPVVGGPKYTVVADAYRRRGVDLDAVERRVAESNRAPLPVPITAIYSQLDAVVAWRACFDDNPANEVRYVEVRSGHAELGFAPGVMQAVAAALRP